MERLAGIEAKLNQAFKLASFILGERETAIHIALDATAKLEAAIAAQDKRLYYEAKSRNKVTLSEEHLLQRLVYIESEPYERARERSSDHSAIDEETLLVHFIKHLVRITMRRTSFYVTLGLSRVLHNYSTRETMEIYNIVVQDPGRVREDSYYRSRKGILISELKKRFGDLLSIRNGPHNETRFEVQNDSSRYLDLIRRCLTQFTPWFTPCVIPEDFNPIEHELPHLSFRGSDPDEEHRTEVARMHAILHPSCYQHLINGLRQRRMSELSYGNPEQKLQIPRFNLSQNGDSGSGPPPDRKQPAELSEEELAALRRELAEQTARRKQWGSGLLRILVNGDERARFDPRQTSEASFRIEDGEELIEIYGQGKNAETLLAVQLLNYDDESQEILPAAFALKLAGGQELAFALAPEKKSEEDHFYIQVEVTYREIGLSQSALIWARRLKRRLFESWNQWKGGFGVAGLTIEAGNRLARRRAPVLIGAASALLTLGLGLGLWWVFFYQSLIDKGTVALHEAYRERRPYETRISGFDYAPFPQMRGAAAEKIDYIALDRAERLLLDAVAENSGPTAYHALGRFYLARKEIDKAIDQFETALQTDPANAQLHSDLGVALLEKGKEDRLSKEHGKSLGEFAKSLECFNQALKLDDSLLEALFNRALCHQYMLLQQQASGDWQKYLEKDPYSRWAEEARQNLKSLGERQEKNSRTKERLFQDFLHAYRAGDNDEAWEIVSQNREILPTGRHIPWQLLDAFSERITRGHLDQANETLQALLYVGKLEALKTGDRYTLDLALYYQSSSPQQHLRLAQAHALMNRGHKIFTESKFIEASSLYTAARQIFRQVGDRWEAMLAYYFSGYCALQTTVAEQSFSTFEHLARASEEENYLWMLARSLNALGSVQSMRNEHSKGIANTERSLEISERIADTHGIQKNQAQLANNYKSLGDYDRALIYLDQCLSSGNEVWPKPRQMWRTYDTLAQVLRLQGFYGAAAAYGREALQLASDEIRDPGFIYPSLIHLGMIFWEQQNLDEAVRLVQLGFDMAKARSREPGWQYRVAYAALQLGHLYYQAGQFNQAVDYYDKSIELHKSLDSQVNTYESYKGRFLCYVARGDNLRAKTDLDKLAEMSEGHRAKIIEEKNRNTFFDLEQSFYDAAINFQHSRLDDSRAAFELSEASRARSLLDLINTDAQVLTKNDEEQFVFTSVSQPLKLEEIQARLPEQAQLLQYAALKDKLLIWVISSTKLSVTEQAISLSDLTEKAFNYYRMISKFSHAKELAEEIRKESEALYDILIKPVEPLLDSEKQICIMPDKALNYLPFNTLTPRGSDKRLIDDYHVSFSLSSTIYLLCSELARNKESGNSDERILSVGNPSFDREAVNSLPDLPSAETEARKVAEYYRPSIILTEDDAREGRIKTEMRKSEVVHLASHYIVDEKSPMRSRLLLAREPDGDSQHQVSPGVLQADEIYNTYKQRPSRTRLAVLSACQTGVERFYNGEGMIGMSRIFIAGGVPLVIASLWPVDSDATTELMVNFHRYRKREGLSTIDALRLAQLDMTKSHRYLYQQPGYWAGFIVIGGYATF